MNAMKVYQHVRSDPANGALLYGASSWSDIRQRNRFLLNRSIRLTSGMPYSAYNFDRYVDLPSARLSNSATACIDQRVNHHSTCGNESKEAHQQVGRHAASGALFYVASRKSLGGPATAAVTARQNMASDTRLECPRPDSRIRFDRRRSIEQFRYSIFARLASSGRV